MSKNILKFIKEYSLAICFLTVIVVNEYYDLLSQSDYLYELQEHSLWSRSHTIMSEVLGNDNGWLTYISCYLTQYFYYPWLGSTIMILMWITSYIFMIKADILKIKTEEGLSLPRNYKQYLYAAFIIISFVLLKSSIEIFYDIYDGESAGKIFVPTIIFMSLSICFSIVWIILRKIKNDKLQKSLRYAKILVFIVLLISINLSGNTLGSFRSHPTFNKEMKMYRAVEECRWDDVLKEAPKVNEDKKESVNVSTLMVMFNNLALLHTNQLMETVFDFNNNGQTPEYFTDSPYTMARQAGPLLYYYFGQINYAYRWAIENSVKQHPTVDNIKMLIRCAIFNQEFEVAMKYINILKTTTFHRDWALEREAMVMDNLKFVESAEYNYISPLIEKEQENELDTDENNIYYYILDHFANKRTSKAPQEELAIVSSLLLQQEETFMIHFYDFCQNHPQAEVPRVMQEAAYLIGPTELSPIDVSQFPFDMNIKTSFSEFNARYNDYTVTYKKKNYDQKFLEYTIGQDMKPLFGNTYWWYYYFCSNVAQY